MSNKFEMGPSIEQTKESEQLEKPKSNQFKQLSIFMGNRNHLDGMSRHGVVAINKQPEGSIEVAVVNSKKRGTVHFQLRIYESDVYENRIRVEGYDLTRPATDRRRVLADPESFLDEILSSFKEKVEEPQ